ncbi:MAG TPA: PEP-CTERM sorting domain-containing protein [Bryobacteraceae bacterium]|nr:PEP-CTERM sorting domain-containing protein [Bryobacteraceae bacterium]
MKKINFALAAILAVGTANAAIISGDTQSYGPTATDFSGLPVSLAGYDGLSGTLIGVILTMTGHIDTQYNASNDSAQSGQLLGANTTSTMSLFFGAVGVVTAIPVTSLTGAPYIVPAISAVTNYGSLATGENSNSATFNTPNPLIAAFISGPVSFTVNSSTITFSSTTGGNVAVGQSTVGSGTAHVDFIVADTGEIPEPASLALIGGGLTGLAYLLRRRKAA